MIASRLWSGRLSPGPESLVMVAAASLGRVCPHQYDETRHRNVRPACRLPLRGVGSEEGPTRAPSPAGGGHAGVACPVSRGGNHARSHGIAPRRVIMAPLAGFPLRHRRWIIGFWLLILIAGGAAAGRVPH